MQEKRKHPRREISTEVLVSWAGQPSHTFLTGDASEGGVFLLAGEVPLPEVGTEIIVTLPEFLSGPNKQNRKARVVRSTPRGIGIAFLDN